MSRNEGEQRVFDNSLIVEARQKPAAFIQLYRRCYDDVFRYCVHRLFDRDTAEDVTSEIFLKVVQHFHRFDGNNEPQFRRWLYRVATNEINSHLRKRKRRQGLLQRFAQQTRPAVADPPEPTQERLSLLKEAMLTLRPRYQTIITLRFLENLRTTEIAEVLGCSPATARSQLARAMRRLRKTLAAAGAFNGTGGTQDEEP